MASKKYSFFKRPIVKLLGIAISVTLIIAMIIATIFYTTRSLFSSNKHFTMRRIIVKSGGWWKNKNRDVCNALNLEIGESNLFAIDYKKGKKILELEPSIAKVSIYKILPDTLAVEITERVPRAYLHWSGNKYVIDDNAVIMATDSCVNIPKNLPIITGFRADVDEIKAGNKLLMTYPALKLLKQSKKQCPRVIFKRISLNNVKEFNTTIYDFNTQNYYKLLLPRKYINLKLDELNLTLKKLPFISSKKIKSIDLRFEGQAVLK